MCLKIVHYKEHIKECGETVHFSYKRKSLNLFVAPDFHFRSSSVCKNVVITTDLKVRVSIIVDGQIDIKKKKKKKQKKQNLKKKKKTEKTKTVGYTFTLLKQVPQNCYVSL